jgi:hypothetical protein
MPINELATSPQYSYNEGNPVVTRNFYAYPYDSEALIRSELIKFEPLYIFAAGGLPADPDLRLILRDLQIVKDANNRRGYFVTLIYKDGTGARTTFNPLQPNDDNYATYRLSTEGRFVDMWRQWTTDAALRSVVRAKTDDNYVPLYGVNDALSDIGGQKIDVAGTPTSVIVPMQRLIVDITTIELPALRFFRPYLGTRNKTIFLGCDVGTAVCLGADATEMQPSRWKISLSFEIDKYYHLKQVPIRNASGYVELDQGGDTNALGRGQASRVAWVQPHPEVTEFRDIHPALSGMRSP